MMTSKSNQLDPDECGCCLKEKRRQSCNPLKTESWDLEFKTKKKNLDYDNSLAATHVLLRGSAATPTQVLESIYQ